MICVVKSSSYTLSNTGHRANIEITLEVVTYNRLKTVENHKTVSPKKWSRSETGGGRLLEVPTIRL